MCVSMDPEGGSFLTAIRNKDAANITSYAVRGEGKAKLGPAEQICGGALWLNCDPDVWRVSAGKVGERILLLLTIKRNKRQSTHALKP
jgi:hypothetical protein